MRPRGEVGQRAVGLAAAESTVDGDRDRLGRGDVGAGAVHGRRGRVDREQVRAGLRPGDRVLDVCPVTG